MIWRRSGGQSLVEFALVAPILIFLAMAVWDGGGVLREQIVLQQAARDGARVAATAYAPAVLPACTSTTSGSVSDAVLASAGDLPGLSRTPGYLSVCYPDAQSVQVQITSVHTLFTPVLRWVWGGSQGSLTLHASATFFLPLAPATVVPPPPTPTQTQTPTITPTPTSTPVPPTATPTLTPTSTPTPTPAAVKLGFKVQPSNTVAGASFTPAVQVSVQDALGNTVTTSTALITLAIGANPGGGAITGLVTVPAVGGVATFSNLSINRTGVGYTLIASNASLSPATSAAFNILVGPASKLAFTVQPSNAAVVTNIAPAVQVAVQDASGNTVTSSTASISLAIGANPGGGTLTGPAVAAVSGVATFNTLSINKIGVGYTLIASSGVLGATTSTAFNIQPGAPSKLVFSVQPTNTVAGASIAPAVQVVVQDSLGNTATSSSAPITLAIAAGANPGGGILSGISTVNATAGVAGFGALSINRPGVGYKLTATSPGLTPVTSTVFNITLGAASRLAFTVQPSDEVAATNLSPNVQVTVQDSSGNTITGSSASISLGIGANPGGGTLSGTATRPASSGVVSFTSMSIDKTGVGYTLVASSAGLTGATSVAFDITPGAATKLAFSVQPTNEQVGVSIAPAVQVSVQDAQGNTVTSSSASISMIVLANPGGGSLGGTTTVSAVSGVATFGNLTISRIGTGYLLRASSAGLGTVTSVSFNITAVPTGTPTPTLTPTPTPTPPPTPTITPIPTVTPTPTMTPTPVQPCVLEPSTQPVPLLQNGFGYWCTVQVSDTSWVLGNWQVNSDPNNQLLIYAGNPFAGQSDPVLQSPTADIGSNYQFGGQLWTATGCLTPGTYTVYFYNFGSQFPASDGAVWIFGC